MMSFFTRENSKGAYYEIYNTVNGSQIMPKSFRLNLVTSRIFKGEVMKIILMIYFLKNYLFCREIIQYFRI